MSFLNLMTLRLIPCFLMDLYNVFIFKSEWTYVTDCVDFSSALHGLQMAEYSREYSMVAKPPNPFGQSHAIHCSEPLNPRRGKRQIEPILKDPI